MSEEESLFLRLGNWTVKMPLWFYLTFVCYECSHGLSGFSVRFKGGGKTFGVGRGRKCLHLFVGWFWNLSLLEYIFSILEQTLEVLNRTQTLLNFGFLIQWQQIFFVAGDKSSLQNLLFVITHVSHVCSQHLFGPPLRTNRICRRQFEHVRFNLLPLNLITHVWTICHGKPTQSTHCTGAKTFDLGSSSPTLLNLWLLHVQVYLYISSCQ